MKLLGPQDQVSKFIKDKCINSKIDIRIIDLISEVGELSKEILKGTNYGNKQFEKTKDWESEIGDVFFSLICIANETDTNLEDCLNYVLKKYEKRFTDNGDLGSGE
ncbi:MAG: MazG nucleotide pyrophosphohydrolase domain-containing protein [Bacillota bacterium]|nr:MazG nucleotide pyrophosphohydrolase domain-containing protein [Bacillota bacterium]